MFYLFQSKNTQMGKMQEGAHTKAQIETEAIFPYEKCPKIKIVNIY
jgi:hypothetical protein